MPYFPAGGGVAYRPPMILSGWRPASQSYRQPARGTRGRLGQSLSDILGTISDVAGTVSQDTGGGGSGPSYYGSAPYYPPSAPATTGLSTTTLLLGAAAIGGVIFLATRKG